MKASFLMALTAALALTACADLEIRPTTAREHVLSRNYTLGEAQVAHVGAPIVRVKDYFAVRYPAFTNAAPYSSTGGGGVVTQYPAGSSAKLMANVAYKGIEYRALEPQPPLADGSWMLIDQRGRYSGLALFMGDFYDHCDDTVCVQPANVDFVASDGFIDVPESGTAYLFNFELVYSGATKDALHLLYREYTPDDMARPAFTQNLTYDRDTPTIRFRELRIQVLEASNERLRYIVEADGMKEG